MRKFPIIISSLFSLALVSGCKKEFKPVAEYQTSVPTQANLKINYNSAYNANPSVQIKINDVRVSNLLTARTPFPGGGFNTGGDNRPDYLQVNPGAVKISISIPKKDTPTDSIVLFTSNINVEANKYYTAHITDTAANTKLLLQTDDLANPAANTSRYKFVHLIPNVGALDLYHGGVLVASNVPYLGSVTFTRPIPGASSVWDLREAGTSPTSTVLATYTSANTIINMRVYTIFAVGYKGQTSTVRRPYVSFFLNK